jgi:hypothetical protein
MQDIFLLFIHKSLNLGILDNIQKLTSESKSFDFLNDEENLYDENDLKERYK